MRHPRRGRQQMRRHDVVTGPARRRVLSVQDGGDLGARRHGGLADDGGGGETGGGVQQGRPGRRLRDQGDGLR